MELPAFYVESRRCVAAISRSDPRLLEVPAWRSLLSEEVEAALAAFRDGRAQPLGGLLADVPQVLSAWEPIRHALVADIETRRFDLLRRIIRSRPGKQREPEAMDYHREVESLRSADDFIRRTGGQVYFGENRVRSMAASTEDQRLVEIAERTSGGSDTGYARRSGTYGKVKRAIQRVREGGVLRLLVRYVLCDEHIGATAPAPVGQGLANWSGTTLPSENDIRRAKTILVRRVSATLAIDPGPF